MPASDGRPTGTEPDPGLDELAAAIGHRFDDLGVLERALRHRSWCAEHGGVTSNERLEYLGDAVLGWVVADLAFHRFGGDAEGRLTELRKAVVNSSALAEIARSVGVGPHLRLGRGESMAGGADKESILSDAFEAIIAAVYLDGGPDAAFGMVERLVGPHLATSVDRTDRIDHKTVLQERCARDGLGAPVYGASSTGPDHAKAFTVVVLLGGVEHGRGTGRSKKSAEQAAAADAVARLDAAPGD